MLCILCVTHPEILINIFDECGVFLNIGNIIPKYFWLQPKADDENAKFICYSCWNALDTFHRFYEKIIETHITLANLNFELQNKDSSVINNFNIYEGLLSVNVVNYENSRRSLTNGRSLQAIENNEGLIQDINSNSEPEIPLSRLGKFKKLLRERQIAESRPVELQKIEKKEVAGGSGDARLVQDTNSDSEHGIPLSRLAKFKRLLRKRQIAGYHKIHSVKQRKIRNKKVTDDNGESNKMPSTVIESWPTTMAGVNVKIYENPEVDQPEIGVEKTVDLWQAIANIEEHSSNSSEIPLSRLRRKIAGYRKIRPLKLKRVRKKKVTDNNGDSDKKLSTVIESCSVRMGGVNVDLYENSKVDQLQTEVEKTGVSLGIYENSEGLVQDTSSNSELSFPLSRLAKFKRLLRKRQIAGYHKIRPGKLKKVRKNKVTGHSGDTDKKPSAVIESFPGISVQLYENSKVGQPEIEAEKTIGSLQVIENNEGLVQETNSNGDIDKKPSTVIESYPVTMPGISVEFYENSKVDQLQTEIEKAGVSLEIYENSEGLVQDTSSNSELSFPLSRLAKFKRLLRKRQIAGYHKIRPGKLKKVRKNKVTGHSGDTDKKPSAVIESFPGISVQLYENSKVDQPEIEAEQTIRSLQVIESNEGLVQETNSNGDIDKKPSTVIESYPVTMPGISVEFYENSKVDQLQTEIEKAGVSLEIYENSEGLVQDTSSNSELSFPLSRLAKFKRLLRKRQIAGYHKIRPGKLKKVRKNKVTGDSGDTDKKPSAVIESLPGISVELYENSKVDQLQTEIEKAGVSLEIYENSEGLVQDTSSNSELSFPLSRLAKFKRLLRKRQIAGYHKIRPGKLKKVRKNKVTGHSGDTDKKPSAVIESYPVTMPGISVELNENSKVDQPKIEVEKIIGSLQAIENNEGLVQETNSNGDIEKNLSTVIERYPATMAGVYKNSTVHQPEIEAEKTVGSLQAIENNEELVRDTNSSGNSDKKPSTVIESYPVKMPGISVELYKISKVDQLEIEVEKTDGSLQAIENNEGLVQETYSNGDIDKNLSTVIERYPATMAGVYDNSKVDQPEIEAEKTVGSLPAIENNEELVRDTNSNSEPKSPLSRLKRFKKLLKERQIADTHKNQPAKLKTKRKKKVTDNNGESNKKVRRVIESWPATCCREETKERVRPMKFDKVIKETIQLSCDICLAPLSNFMFLQDHYQLVHNQRGYAVCCTKKFDIRSTLVDHILLHKYPNYFNCHKCSKVLANRKVLRQHLKTHDDRLTYKCEKCSKTFHRQLLLDRHMYIHMERKFKCEECDKLFASKLSLGQHVYCVHRGGYRKVCEQCGKVSRDQVAFSRHMLQHIDGPRPFVECEKCGVKLVNQSGLRKHMKSQHAENQVTQVCNICGVVKANAYTLNRHINYVHKYKLSHKCGMCSKAFKTPLLLKVCNFKFIWV